MPPWQRPAILCPFDPRPRPSSPGTSRSRRRFPAPTPFDDRDWLFSVDWDGARALLFLDPGGAVRIQGEMPGDLARRFPDVAAPAAVRGGRGAVLDGVIAVLDREGRPDLAGFGRRLAAGPAAAHELPAVYLGSDLLHLDGRSTLGWPLDRRLDALGELAGQSDALQVPDHVRGRGEALAAAAAGRGLAALLARRASAPYRPGVASPDRLRIALTNQTTCVVAGIVSRRRGGTRLILGEHVAGRLTFAGHVDGPRDRLVAGWLAQRAADLTVSGAPLDGVQPVNATWLRPGAHRDRPAPGSQLRGVAASAGAACGSRRRRSSLVRAATRGGGPDRAARGDAILADAPDAATPWRREPRCPRRLDDRHGPDVPTRPLRHRIRDQPVDARRGQGRPRAGRGAMGRALSHLCRPRRRDRTGCTGRGSARHGLHRQRGRALGRPRRPEQLPSPRAAGGGGALAPGARAAGLRRP